jgi:hypothetical protein
VIVGFGVIDLGLATGAVGTGGLGVVNHPLAVGVCSPVATGDGARMTSSTMGDLSAVWLASDAVDWALSQNREGHYN